MFVRLCAHLSKPRAGGDEMLQAEEPISRRRQLAKLFETAQKAFACVAVEVDKPRGFAVLFAENDYLRA